MNFRIYLVGLVKYFWKGKNFNFCTEWKKSFFFLAESEVLILDKNRAFSKKILENITLVIEEMDGENREFE